MADDAPEAGPQQPHPGRPRMLREAAERSRFLRLVPSKPGAAVVIFLGGKRTADAIREQLRPKEDPKPQPRSGSQGGSSV